MADFDDGTVVLRTRTGKDEEFMSGGGIIVIDAKKGIRVPRYVAELAFSQLALKWDNLSGAVVDSLIYEHDADKPAPKTITADEIKQIKKTSGMGKDNIMVDGKKVPMRTIDLNPGE